MQNITPCLNIAFHYEYNTLIDRLRTIVLKRHFDFFLYLDPVNLSPAATQFVLEVMTAKAKELESNPFDDDWLWFFRVVSFLNMRELLALAIQKLSWFSRNAVYTLRTKTGTQMVHLNILEKFRFYKWYTDGENDTDVFKHWILSDRSDNICLKCNSDVLKVSRCEKWWVKHCSFCDEMKVERDCRNCGHLYLEFLLRNS